MGDRIPPEVSEKWLIGSSAESGEPSSLFVLESSPLGFNPGLQLLSRWMLFLLTHGGKPGCIILLRLFVGAELPSLWVTGPVEVFRLPLALWVGRLDIELRPESESVPEKKSEGILIYPNFSFKTNHHILINKISIKTWKCILLVSIVWTLWFLWRTKDAVQAVVASLCGGRTLGNYRFKGSRTDQWLLNGGLEERDDTESELLFPVLYIYVQWLIITDSMEKASPRVLLKIK